MSLERGMVREILEEIEVAVREIAARHGLELDHQRAQFGASEMTSRVTLRAAGAAEAQEEFGRMQFPVLAARFGLPAEAVGETFNHRGYTFTVTGLKPERPKYPVCCTRSDGRKFKFPAHTVREKLEAAKGHGANR